MKDFKNGLLDVHFVVAAKPQVQDMRIGDAKKPNEKATEKVRDANIHTTVVKQEKTDIDEIREKLDKSKTVVPKPNLDKPKALEVSKEIVRPNLISKVNQVGLHLGPQIKITPVQIKKEKIDIEELETSVPQINQQRSELFASAPKVLYLSSGLM